MQIMPEVITNGLTNTLPLYRNLINMIMKARNMSLFNMKSIIHVKRILLAILVFFTTSQNDNQNFCFKGNATFILYEKYPRSF